jgi:hypothetical protein
MPAPAMPHSTASERAAAFAAANPTAVPTLPSAAEVQRQTAPTNAVADILAPGVNETAAAAAAAARARLDAAHKRGQRKIRLAAAVAVVIVAGFTAFGVWAWPTGGGDEAETATSDVPASAADTAASGELPTGPFAMPTYTAARLRSTTETAGGTVTLDLTVWPGRDIIAGALDDDESTYEFLTSPTAYYWRVTGTDAWAPPDDVHPWIHVGGVAAFVGTIDVALAVDARDGVTVSGEQPAILDGVEVTHWTLDLDATAAAAAGIDATAVPADGTVQVEYWVDADGIVRQLRAPLADGVVTTTLRELVADGTAGPEPIMPTSDFDFEAYRATHPA